MIIPRNCDNCNRSYQAETRELNRGNGVYCSRKCSGEARTRKALEEAKTPNATCGYCNIDMYVTEKRRSKSKSGLFFCSRQHQGLGFSDPSVPVTSGPVNKESRRKLCLGVGCPTKTENIYCRSCRMQNEKMAWLAGDNSKSWITTTREPRVFVKQHVLEIRGDRCEECSYDKKRPDGSSKIQLDHIDGDYMNNSLSNLKLLCPNCHEDTPTFGSRNKNGGRRYRLAQALNRTLE